MGAWSSDACPECRGQGQVAPSGLTVRIPPGVDRDAHAPVRGGRDGPQGGPAGDLYVVLTVKPHAKFHREGGDVTSELEVTYAQAVLGATVDAQTLHGPEPIDIPAGTQPGHQFRLKGKGVQRLDRAGKGDHIARVRLVAPRPRDLSPEQIDLLRQLAEVEGSEVREGRGVLGKVKDLFG